MCQELKARREERVQSNSTARHISKRRKVTPRLVQEHSRMLSLTAEGGNNTDVHDWQMDTTRDRSTQWNVQP